MAALTAQVGNGGQISPEHLISGKNLARASEGGRGGGRGGERPKQESKRVKCIWSPAKSEEEARQFIGQFGAWGWVGVGTGMHRSFGTWLLFALVFCFTFTQEDEIMYPSDN